MTRRVLLATSWNTPCGIAEHSRLLCDYTSRADPEITILPSSELLDPASDAARSAFHDMAVSGIDVLHLNHHDALHSRWTPQHVEAFVEAGLPVVVTYHDTREHLDDTPKLRELAKVASAIVTHEPVHGLAGPRVFCWRQGIPDAAEHPWQYGVGNENSEIFKAYFQQPLIGTVGFNFPWKNYDRLAQLTGELGWALLIMACNATDLDVARWRMLNPSTRVITGFLDSDVIIGRLAGCDASVFAYECANTGTSGAIRLGIAARKPVIAFQTCRQFKDLQHDADNRFAIRWVEDWAGLRRQLIYYTAPGRYDARIVALAQRDSWRNLGRMYANLYRDGVATPAVLA